MPVPLLSVWFTGQFAPTFAPSVSYTTPQHVRLIAGVFSIQVCPKRGGLQHINAIELKAEVVLPWIQRTGYDALYLVYDQEKSGYAENYGIR